MTLKTAALLAMSGMILTTALVVFHLIFDILNTLRGLVPAIAVFSSCVYAFAACTAAIFLYVFYRTQ